MKRNLGRDGNEDVKKKKVKEQCEIIEKGYSNSTKGIITPGATNGISQNL